VGRDDEQKGTIMIVDVRAFLLSSIISVVFLSGCFEADYYLLLFLWVLNTVADHQPSSG
jgi:hypothetical protein